MPVKEPLLQLEERVKKRRRARRNATRFTQIELSGLLAVCVVLLIVFLVSSSPPHHSLPVDMAVASHAVPMPDAEKEDAITVMIARDGRVYFRNYRTTLDDLSRAIKEAVRDGSERKVYVKADARARYSDVKATIDEIRLAGIREVVFFDFPSLKAEDVQAAIAFAAASAEEDLPVPAVPHIR
jgi:biopolymer transport protein TolR